MANKKSIQLLRGSKDYDPSISEEILLDGQPFYSKKENRLWIGDGISKLQHLTPTPDFQNPTSYFLANQCHDFDVYHTDIRLRPGCGALILGNTLQGTKMILNATLSKGTRITPNERVGISYYKDTCGVIILVGSSPWPDSDNVRVTIMYIAGTSSTFSQYDAPPFSDGSVVDLKIESVAGSFEGTQFRPVTIAGSIPKAIKDAFYAN